MPTPTRKLYRCHRPSCQAKNRAQFWQAASLADPAKCPQCGLAADDPNYGAKIQRLVVVHLDPPSEFPGQGLQRRACNLSQGIQAQIGDPTRPSWHAGTGSVTDVNCEECMKTEVYKAMMAIVNDDDPGETSNDETPTLAPATIAALERFEKLPRRIA